MTGEYTTNTIREKISDNAKKRSTSILQSKAVLLILSSNFLGKSFIISKPYSKIGRLGDCDVIINDPLVSKEHCEVSLDDNNKFYIEDLESKNSTFVNGKKIKKKTHLIYGDRIIIGNTILRFYLEEKLEA